MKTKMSQLKALEVMQWILDPISHCREGRSHTVMLAYINLAFRYPGVWLRVRDHYPNHMADERLLGYLRHYVKINFKMHDWEFKHDEFRLVI